VVGEAELEPLAPLLAPAFARFLGPDAVKRDPRCRAKLAIAQALCKLRVPSDEVYLAGVRHHQLEPTFGGKEDTAGALRGQCAVGLALTDDPAAPVAIAELLADPEADARAAAVQALTCIHPSAAEPLLRYKIRLGDPQPQVVAECFRSLLAVAPPSAVAVIAEHLQSASEDVAEQAALALGESRRLEAFGPLRDVAESALGDRRRVALLAIAMLRSNQTRDYLLDRVTSADASSARHALEALAIFRHDDSLRARVLEAAARRNDPELLSQAHDLLRP
jgi:HEAT repeat protein